MGTCSSTSVLPQAEKRTGKVRAYSNAVVVHLCIVKSVVLLRQIGDICVLCCVLQVYLVRLVRISSTSCVLHMKPFFLPVDST